MLLKISSSVATTSFLIPFVALLYCITVCTTSSSIPFVATVQNRPLFLMLLQPHHLFLKLLKPPPPLFLFLLQFKLTLSSLCCYNLILNYSLLVHHPQFLLLLLYTVQYTVHCTVLSSTPYVTTEQTCPLFLMLLHTTSSSISSVVTTSSLILLLLQPHPLCLMLLQHLPLFPFLLQYEQPHPFLCCYNLILYYSMLR